MEIVPYTGGQFPYRRAPARLHVCATKGFWPSGMLYPTPSLAPLPCQRREGYSVGLTTRGEERGGTWLRVLDSPVGAC